MSHLDMLDAIEANANRKLGESDGALQQLSEVEQIAVIRRAFQWEVNNGGLYTFMWNSSGDYAHVTVTVLQLIGAVEAALIVEQANALFGQGGPSLEVRSRRQQMAFFDDDQRARMEQLTTEYFALEDAGLSTADLFVSYVVGGSRESAS